MAPGHYANPRGVGPIWSEAHRDVSAPNAPNATAAAVDVRKTVGPSRTAVAPAADSAAISSSAMPPSGPTISSSESACATGSSVSLTVADSCSTSAVAPSSRTRCTNSAVDTTPADGRNVRAPRLAGGRPGHRTPAAQTLVDLLPPVPPGHTARGLPGDERVGSRLGGQLDGQFGAVGLGQGLHDGDGGGGCTGRSGGPAPAPSTGPCATSSTTQCATVPSPSPRSSSSPARMRRTLAAWKPSSPSTTASSPTSGSAST